MKTLVVLVGHNAKKLERLKKLYYQNIPLVLHDVITVYNGDDDNYDCDIRTKNDKRGLDVKMYYEAIKKFKADWYFFMNDDIVHIEGRRWLIWSLLTVKEIAGMQANLSSFVPMNIIKRESKIVPSKWYSWGTKPQFIRTSAFGCTREYFLRVWKQSNGSAQNFEKKTIQLAKNYEIFPNPFFIHDENLHPYFKYYRR